MAEKPPASPSSAGEPGSVKAKIHKLGLSEVDEGNIVPVTMDKLTPDQQKDLEAMMQQARNQFLSSFTETHKGTLVQKYKVKVIANVPGTGSSKDGEVKQAPDGAAQSSNKGAADGSRGDQDDGSQGVQGVGSQGTQGDGVQGFQGEGLNQNGNTTQLQFNNFQDQVDYAVHHALINQSGILVNTLSNMVKTMVDGSMAEYQATGPVYLPGGVFPNYRPLITDNQPVVQSIPPNAALAQPTAPVSAPAPAAPSLAPCQLVNPRLLVREQPQHSGQNVNRLTQNQVAAMFLPPPPTVDPTQQQPIQQTPPRQQVVQPIQQTPPIQQVVQPIQQMPPRQQGMIAPIREKFSSQDFDSLSHLAQKVTLHEQRFAEARKNFNKVNHVCPYIYGLDDDDDYEIAAAEWVRSKKVIPCQWVKNSGKEERYDFDISKTDKIFDLLLREKKIQLPAGHTIPSAKELGKRRFCWNKGMRLPSIKDCPGCGNVAESSSRSYNRSNRLKQTRVPVHQRLGPVNQDCNQEDNEDRKTQWCPSGIFTKNQKRRVQRLRNRERFQEVEQEINHRLKKTKPRQEWRVKNQAPVADEPTADEAKRLPKGKSVVTVSVNMVFMLPAEFGVKQANVDKVEEESAKLILLPEQAVFENLEGTENRHLKPLYINGYVNGKPMSKMIVDGGAAVNLMPYATFRKLGRNAEDLIKTNMVLKDFGGNPSETKGVLNVELTVGSKTIPTTFFVIDGKGSYSLLLGRDWIHANCCIPSTMHQCLIQWQGDKIEIVPADSIVPVIKKNGKVRVCIGFRDLNKATPKDEYPMPVADQLVDAALGHKILSFMDGNAGYNQIFMAEEDIHKTTFRCPGAIGLFEWVVMTFGLKSTRVTYQRAMNYIYHDLIGWLVEVYIDDVVVKSKEIEDHIADLRKVFERTRKYGLKMNPTKCAFGVSAGQFLGFLVHERGIEITQRSVNAIKKIQPPENKTELQEMIGKINFVRSLLGGAEQQKALDNIKEYLSSPPVLIPPQKGIPFRLYLSAVEIVPWTLFFDGSVCTHGCGIGLVIISPRGACFEFAYTIKPYATNNHAEYEAVLKGLQLLKEVEADAIEIMGDSLLVISQLAGEYECNNDTLIVYNEKCQELMKEFQLTIDGVLLKCLSADQAKVAIGEVHEGICGTHQSAHKMKWLLRRAGYFWPTMLKDCFKYYKGCQDCQKFGAIQRAPVSAMNPIIKPWLFRCWGIDMIDMINPPSSKGHKFILVATDYFTKWVEAIPLKKANSGDAIQFVQEHIIYRFGISQNIMTDQGSIFVSDEFVQFADSMGIKLLNFSPYYAQANGQAEASNKSLIKLIKRKISDYPRQWHTRLAEALWSYRMACHRSIQVPPYKVVYRHETVLPWEVRIGSRRTEL
uniref:Reverse transcriptase (RNA-dependent DNA polymerase), putative n=2 Tax=Oryza sativa subsp. japonica TaxID=39947 RepID=Q53QW9_ORYSJ|nr:retrotransposon protein, putative, unclassified [Oryza sativa Japonica Group]AAX95554.1 Reverse transcriptase (RNA-dependent DNA polymerase), putative [Oryza sativa Japonica Group]AAX95572.1 Reverse transcriptase (RNA-dependent DNA polymerase), putative [Oryza sativa Japonica Group]